MADAALIGLAGFALIAANPSLWVGLWLDSHKITVPMLTLPVFGWVSTFYGLFVPGAVMWLLSVRRAHSHEMYSLLRAPLVAFIILLPLTIIMIIMKVPVVAEIKAPLIIINHGTHQILTIISLVGIFLQGLGFSFLGVSIIELASRIRKRQNLIIITMSTANAISPVRSPKKRYLESQKKSPIIIQFS